MIVSPKGREVVKVVDFGIAKAGTAEPGQNVTKTGLVVGTPEYMSPEQLSGDKVDGRSDIYSLALVFYRMITDTLPFVADTAQETMIKRLTDEPIPLAQARPDSSFPPALQKVMDRALARWPQDRYASATEFAADAERAIGGAKSMVTSADTEAKTQVVRPSDISGAKTAAIPATRVTSPKPASKMSPAVIGAGVVVLALAGGGYVMRDSLFGGDPGSVVADTNGARNPGDTGVQRFSQQAGESTFPPVDSQPVQPNGNTNPPRNPNSQTNTPADSGRRVTPNPNTPVKVSVPLPDLEEIFDAGTRAAARRKAEAIYQRTDVLDSLRAEAAALVGQAYAENADFESAKDWYTKANQMFRRQTFANLIADADRNIRRLQQGN
jgi:serine/threonine protein kinase